MKGVGGSKADDGTGRKRGEKVREGGNDARETIAGGVAPGVSKFNRSTEDRYQRSDGTMELSENGQWKGK